jgi:hypothetical protein
MLQVLGEQQLEVELTSATWRRALTRSFFGGLASDDG